MGSCQHTVLTSDLRDGAGSKAIIMPLQGAEIENTPAPCPNWCGEIIKIGLVLI